MQLERQLKIALDESRLLILGAQVLFGFQFNGVFQEQFKELPFTSRVFVCTGLILIMVAVALPDNPGHAAPYCGEGPRQSACARSCHPFCGRRTPSDFRCIGARHIRCNGAHRISDDSYHRRRDVLLHRYGVLVCDRMDREAKETIHVAARCPQANSP